MAIQKRSGFSSRKNLLLVLLMLAVAVLALWLAGPAMDPGPSQQTGTTAADRVRARTSSARAAAKGGVRAERRAADHDQEGDTTKRGEEKREAAARHLRR